MTQEDSVRRLVEIRAREVITSHPLPLEVVGAVDVLCSMIDSLTAEREEVTCALLEQIKRKEFFIQKALADESRAEAAEADRERLREGANTVMLALKTGAYMDGFNGPAGFSSADDAIEWAIVELAALATPPSEGGQSDG